MKREQGKAQRNLPRQRFSVLLWRLLAAFDEKGQIFFFPPFRFKKSSSALWEIAQSQTDTRAPSFRLFRTKNSIFISIHKFYIALVEHT